MTQGSIWKQLVFFSVPLLIGYMLQQTYNAFDAAVVGRYVSKEALAAVGSSGPLTGMIVSFFMGMSSGSSVLIARFFGARNYEDLKKTVHTAILLAILMGVVLSLIGVVFSPMLIRLTQTPDEIFTEAVTYLRIYFAGLTGLTVYNMGAAILTATGDSKRPLYFLMLSTVIHIALNLLFVIGFDMGVAGVAWSTVISQMVCAVLIIWLLCRHQTVTRLELRKLRLHKSIVKQIVGIGLPGGIQGAIISFSNMIVQSYINRLGPIVVAGYGTNTRIDGYINMPIQAISLAISTFVSQNLGSGQVKRARSGVRAAMVLGVGSTAFLAVGGLVFGRSLFSLFTTDTEVIAASMMFMRVFAPFDFLLCINNVLIGSLRGAGYVRLPTILTVSCYVGLRQIYLFFITKISHTVTTVALGFPLGWFSAMILISIYYRLSDWNKFERIQNNNGSA